MKEEGICRDCELPAVAGKTRCRWCAKQASIYSSIKSKEKELRARWTPHRKEPTVSIEKLVGILI